MFSSRTCAAALTVFALTSVSGAAITSIPANATSPPATASAARSDYCTHAYLPYIPHTADAAAFWLAGCHFGNKAVAVPRQPYYCAHAYLPYIPHTADAAAYWLAGCHFDYKAVAVPRQPYYCAHAYLPYIPHTADAIAEWLSACDVVGPR